MTDYFVDGSGNDANAGTSWGTGNSWLTPHFALEATGAGAGNRVIMDAAYQYDYATSKTITVAGTDTAPITLLSSTKGADSSTTVAYNPGASIKATGGNYNLVIAGDELISYGVNFVCGNNMEFNFGNDSFMSINDCTLELVGTSAGDRIVWGAVDGRTYLRGCTIKFGGVGQGIQSDQPARLHMIDCTLAGSAITDLIKSLSSSTGPQYYFENCDFTNINNTTGVVIGAVPTANVGTQTRVVMSHCALGGSAVITDETIVTPGTTFEAYGCNAGSAVTGYYYQSIEGVVQDSTSVYMDATNAFSLEMSSTADSTEATQSLRCMLGEVYAAAGATIGVELVVGTTALQDDEFWIEVVYPKTGALATRLTATTLLSHEDGNACDVGLPDLAKTPTNLTASALGAGDWTGEPGSPQFQKAEIDLRASGSGGNVTNASGAGVVQVWVNLAASGAITCYVDSKIVVT